MSVQKRQWIVNRSGKEETQEQTGTTSLNCFVVYFFELVGANRAEAKMTLQEIIRQVDTLSPEEQADLAAYLDERTRSIKPTVKRRRKWSEIAGIAEYPLTGEDAQAWITRDRTEEERELPWRAQE